MRARPNIDHVPYEMDENVPIGKYKIVKTEKVIIVFEKYTSLDLYS